jgi:hypothetical protein
LCEAIVAEPLRSYKAYVAGPGGQLVDGDEAPHCDSVRFTSPKPKPPWTDAGVVCLVHQYSLTAGHGAVDCSIAVATEGRWWSGVSVPGRDPPEDEPRHFRFDPEIFEAFVVAIPDPRLVVRFRISDVPLSEQFTVCRTGPKRGCSAPMATEGEGWKLKPVQDGADLAVVKEAGDPPADELGTVTTLLKY